MIEAKEARCKSSESFSTPSPPRKHAMTVRDFNADILHDRLLDEAGVRLVPVLTIRLK
jgi:hypothetical protein